jgi:uncharacterized protein YyaL (SSP411 family)
LINNAELAWKPVQIILVGEPTDARFVALRRAVYSVSLPRAVIQMVTPDQALPANHPAHGKGLIAGKSAAYVCEGPICSLPIVESQHLIDALAKIR